MLAELGYVGFAIDMYGKGVEGKSPQDGVRLSGPFKKDRNLMRARAGAAYDVLKKHPKVDPKKIAAMGYCFGGATVLELARGGYDLTGVVSFHGALETPMPAKAGQVKAKVLACHGAADPFVPLPEVTAFEKEMTDAGVDWQLVAYGGAVHSFTNPQANNKAGGAAYNPAADRRSWEAMKAFFAEVFK
jgi:dienelactone hydrolase